MPNDKSKSYLVPFLLFLFSLLLRLSLISKGPYHLDCLNLTVLAKKTLETHTLQGDFGPGYPLTVLLGAFFIFISRIFFQNDPVIAVNLMSVVFSSLSIPVFYIIANRLFGRSAACLSSIMFSINPIFLGISVYGKSHTPSMFFLLMALYFLLSFSNSKKKRSLFLSSVFMGLMGAARLPDMVFLIFPLSFLCATGIDRTNGANILDLSKKEILKDLLLFLVPALAVVIIFHAPYLIAPDRDNYAHNVMYFWHLSVAENFIGFFSQPLIISTIYLLKTFTEAGLAIAIIGLIYIAVEFPRIFYFFLLWICIPFLFFANTYGTVPRFFVIILPPLFMAQGFMFSKLMNINFTFRFVSYVINFTIIVLLFTSIYPLLYIRHSNALLPDYAQWVAGKIEHNARFITTDDHPFYSYYGHLNILGRPKHFLFLEDEALDHFKQKLDALLDDDIPVYTTSVGLYAYDPEKKFSSLIERNYDLEVVGTKLYEDWHRGVLTQLIIQNRLIRIRKKNPLFDS